MSKKVTALDKQKAMGGLVIVAIGFVFLSIAVRLMGSGFGPITQTYMRLGGGSLISLLVLRNSIRWNKLFHAPLKDYLVLIVMGTLGYSVGVYFVTLGALRTSLLDVSVITATIPFFVMVYSFFVLREKIKKSLIIFLFVSFMGVSIVATKSFFPSLEHFGIGELYVLLAAASWGWYSICRRLLSPHFNNSEITILVMPIAFASALLFAIIQKESVSLTSFLNPQLLLGLAIGSGLNLVSAQFENYGYATLEVVLASQILLLENLFSPILGFLFYHELVTIPQCVGALLIVAGVYGANRVMNS